jgi:O-antigen/teichoic acid export membrane protein
MVKNMMNREITIINIAALTVSGVTAVAMALSGMAYWSLAWQQVVNAAVLVVGRAWYVKWRPSVNVSFGYIRKTLSFSMKILATTIVNTANQYLLTVVLGRLFRDTRVVGNYFQAYKWDAMAFQTVGGMLAQVAQPVLVSVRDEGDRELQVFRKMMRFAAFLSFPALFGLALVAREFILCTIGQEWTNCVPLLQILCLSGAFMPLFTLFQNLVISHGRSDVMMWLNTGQIVLQLAVVVVASRAGVTAMVAACSAFNVVWLLMWLPPARRIIGLKGIDLLKDTMPFLLAAAAVMAVTYAVTLPVGNLWLLLLTRIVVAAVLYYAVMRGLNVAILRECIQFIRKK